MKVDQRSQVAVDYPQSGSLPSFVPARPAPLVRLAALTSLDIAAEDALEAAIRRRRPVKPRQELVAEGQPVREPLLIVSGWAVRIRQLRDGRRQILGIVLPGDIVCWCGQDQALALSTIVAITPMSVCAAPSIAQSPALQRAFAFAAALDEAHMLAQITRLGRLNAYERVIDFLLELYDRLEIFGLVDAGRISLPLTQEMIADALGLTPVHVNRTLQIIRSDGAVIWKGHDVAIADRERLALRIGRIAPAVSGAINS